MLRWRDIWRFIMFMLVLVGVQVIYALVTGHQLSGQNDTLICVGSTILCAIREDR